MYAIGNKIRTKLVGAVRQVWRFYDEARRSALLAAEVQQINPETGRSRKHWKCSDCGVVTLKVEVDHIVPVGAQPREWREFGPYLSRLFCDIYGLAVLCKKCHLEKTARDRRNRELTE